MSMELSLQTFLWLRDKGGLASKYGTPSHDTPGMITITAEGLQEIASGVPLVKILHRYCCHRFDAPASLQPRIIADTTEGSSSIDRQSATEAARVHNWNVVRTITSQALKHDLPQEQIEIIQRQGDALEAMLVVKRVFDLAKQHREREKATKEMHKALSADPTVVQVRAVLEAKSVAPSKKIGIYTSKSLNGRDRSPQKGGITPL